MKERFCWNCKFEKDCQADGVVTDMDYGICGLHKFFNEREKKPKSPTKKKRLDKVLKMLYNIYKIVKSS